MRNTNADPIFGAILRLSVPAILTFLLQNAYHLNDALFLGITATSRPTRWACS